MGQRRTVRLSDEMMEELQAEAERLERPVAWIIRRAIEIARRHKWRMPLKGRSGHATWVTK